jgi:hypothetical protein
VVGSLDEVRFLGPVTDPLPLAEDVETRLANVLSAAERGNDALELAAYHLEQAARFLEIAARPR